MQKLDVQVDAAALFGADGDASSLDLGELMPEQGVLVDRLREWVKVAFGGPAGMFEKLDREDAEQLTPAMWSTGCHSEGFQATEAELTELFKFLDVEDQGFISEQEVMFLETDQAAREAELLNSKHRHKHQRQRLFAYVYWDNARRAKKPTDHRANKPWLGEAFESLPVLVCEKRMAQLRRKTKKAVEAQQIFRQHIMSTFGNEARAWRRGLDPDGRFKVDKMTLRNYCRKADLQLDTAALWTVLDRDGDGHFTLEELGPRPAQALASFKVWAYNRIGSCAAVWDHPEAVARREQPRGRWASDKKMLPVVFVSALRAMGWPNSATDSEVGVDTVADPKRLCSALDLCGSDLICLEDLQWVDKWDAPEWLLRPPDPGAWATLDALIMRQHSLPLRAWRDLLDKNDDNQVCWEEFRSACRRLKFRGNIAGAWRALDADVDGRITLQEYHPPTAQMLGSFKRFSDTNFGSVELAFKSFDADGSGSLTFSELRRACTRRGWKGDVRMLFNCLGVTKPDGTKRSLVLPDIQFLDNWVDEVTEETVRMQISSPRTSSMRRSASAPLGGHVGAPPKGGRSSAMAADMGVMDEAVATVGASPPPPLHLVPASPATPMSQHEKLHRTYHCMAVASTGRRRQPSRGGGPRPLAWLERINHIDGLSPSG